MHQYRITKYNPKYRDIHGRYLVKEWTSFSDIGKKINGIILTENEYCNTESNYINVVCKILKTLNIEQLKIVYIENYYNKEINCSVNEYINVSILKKIIKMILREELWCKFESKDFYLHFGYDYYMYIGCLAKREVINSIANQHGLFVESFPSPYL